MGEILDEPTSLFDLFPPTYREISKIIHKMKSSGSACPFDYVSGIALKRCPILRSAFHCIIVYCWQNSIIPETWKRIFCVLIYKKGSPKEPSNFRPITEPVCAKVLTSLTRNRIYSYLIKKLHRNWYSKRVLDGNLWYSRTYRDFNLHD